MVSSRGFGGHWSEHHWRAVGLPGTVEVPQLACRGGVSSDPRPRALEFARRWSVSAARSWRAVVLPGAGGSTSSLAGGLCCRAALTRASARFIVVVSCGRARLAGGRTFGTLPWSNSLVWSMRIHNGRQPISNYAIKPTPELARRSNRTLPPARLIAALEVS